MHYCLVNPAPCTQRYFTLPPKTGLQVSECGTSKINLASFLVFLPFAMNIDLEFANVIQGLTIKQDSLALLTMDGCDIALVFLMHMPYISL